jgi:hypothetical protein
MPLRPRRGTTRLSNVIVACEASTAHNFGLTVRLSISKQHEMTTSNISSSRKGDFLIELCDARDVLTDDGLARIFEDNFQRLRGRQRHQERQCKGSVFAS